MIDIRVLTHEDYNDVYEMCKDIWDGGDYLPQIFHSWVEDKDGYFICAVDNDTNKVVGTNKYSVLADGTGWLEGIRVHKDYRGRKIGKLLTEHILIYGRQELQKGKIKKLAFSTHASNVESINMMTKNHFEIEQQHLLLHKGFDQVNTDLKPSDFDMKPWNISFQEFKELPYIQRRDGLFHLSFWFQEPTPQLFSYLKEHNCFVSINGFKGLYLFKGEPHFTALDESFEAIETFANYYLMTLKDICHCPPLFSVMEQDQALIEKLKAAGYGSWADWQSDYFYYVMKDR